MTILIAGDLQLYWWDKRFCVEFTLTILSVLEAEPVQVHIFCRRFVVVILFDTYILIFHDELKFINHSNVSKKWWRMNQWEQPDQPSDKPLFKIIQPVEIYFRHQENHESRKTTNKWKCHAIRLFNRLSWNWVIQSFQFGWHWSYFDVRHGC